MKKSIFFSVFTATLLFMAAAGFAAETTAEGATDKTLAALEPSKNPAAAEEAKPAPVATVSSAGKKESAEAAVKGGTIKAEIVASKISSETLSGKKDVEIQVKPETFSAFNPQEMRQRWKVLFSREIASDSIAYTVKPGDSLYVLARKNHTTVDFIKKINDLKSDNIYPKMKLKIHTAPFSIRIDKSKNTLILYSNDEAVKKCSVATGKKNCTPVGEFKITDKLVHPTWFKTGAILSPGSPLNALGTRWMGFDKPGYGIHGTTEPKSIGTQGSEGCIRMLNEEVEELYSMVPVGTKVIIQD